MVVVVVVEVEIWLVGGVSNLATPRSLVLSVFLVGHTDSMLGACMATLLDLTV